MDEEAGATAVDEQGDGVGVVRFFGTMAIVVSLVAGLITAQQPDTGFPVAAGLFAFAGVGLRIEAAIRGR